MRFGRAGVSYQKNRQKIDWVRKLTHAKYRGMPPQLLGAEMTSLLKRIHRTQRSNGLDQRAESGSSLVVPSLRALLLVWYNRIHRTLRRNGRGRRAESGSSLVVPSLRALLLVWCNRIHRTLRRNGRGRRAESGSSSLE